VKIKAFATKNIYIYLKNKHINKYLPLQEPDAVQRNTESRADVAEPEVPLIFVNGQQLLPDSARHQGPYFFINVGWLVARVTRLGEFSPMNWVIVYVG
jgi:hypothetical protein